MGFVSRQTRLNRLSCGNESLCVHILEQIDAQMSVSGINVPVRLICWRCNAERQALQPFASTSQTYLCSEGREMFFLLSFRKLALKQRLAVAEMARKMHLPCGLAGQKEKQY